MHTFTLRAFTQQSHRRLARTGATALLTTGLGLGLAASSAVAAPAAQQTVPDRTAVASTASTKSTGTHYCGYYKGNTAIVARGSGNTRAVKEIQCLVNKRWTVVAGKLDVDGIFGTRTEQAVKNIQKVGGSRAVDGVVGPVTWKHLRYGSWD